MAKIFPSLIAADIMNLRKELEALDPHCDGYHIDIMDNHFVPNLTWGPMFVEAIARETSKPLWVQLMVDDPTVWTEELTLPPYSIISIHIESKGHVRRNLACIRERNIKSSIALNPQTPIETVFPLLDLVDVVLIMSVDPGFSGQPYQFDVESKIGPLSAYRFTDDLKFDIGMDGGIDKENIGRLAAQGVELFAAATAIFGQPNPVKALEELERAAKGEQIKLLHEGK